MGFFDNVRNTVTNVVNEASGYRERLITQREADQARKVFRETIPYGRVYVSNGLGFQQRAYTIPHPVKLGFYVIHIGPDGFADALGGRGSNPNRNVEFTFIHELTHVWQGHNNIFPWGYVCNSIWHQATEGSGAYGYTPGNAWGSYNVEQQAQIVMHWWQQGGRQSDNDPRWRYIRDNVRGLQR
jgi:hypothetical protein